MVFNKDLEGSYDDFDRYELRGEHSRKGFDEFIKKVGKEYKRKPDEYILKKKDFGDLMKNYKIENLDKYFIKKLNYHLHEKGSDDNHSPKKKYISGKKTIRGKTILNIKNVLSSESMKSKIKFYMKRDNAPVKNYADLAERCHAGRFELLYPDVKEMISGMRKRMN